MVTALFQNRRVKVGEGKTVVVYRHRYPAGTKIGGQILQSDEDTVGVSLPITGDIVPDSVWAWHPKSPIPEGSIRKWMQKLDFTQQEIDAAWPGIEASAKELAALE